jgi:pimeloyl-ACP methyl ester carboxylesterase
MIGPVCEFAAGAALIVLDMDTVTSADGTIIAYDPVGDGPPLIVAVGAFCTRQTFIPPADLSRRFTVYTYDRRGRGDSGDTQPYAPEREYEDLAAVAAAVAEDRRDEAVAFWMSDVVHLPAEVLAGMRNMPWLKALEPLTPTLPYDILVTDGGVPTAELAAITVPVLVLGGTNSPAWFQRSVADQAAAIPGGRLQMIDGYDHNAPPEVIAPILFGFFC